MSAMPAHVSIVVYGLTENWLGGLNYYRNLVSAFDGAGDDALKLHVLTDDASFFADLALSPRVQVHELAMLQSRSIPWAMRKALLTATRRDVMLIGALQRLQVRAALFCHVPGAAAAGIRCLPWIPDFQSRHHPELFQPAVVEAEHRRAQLWLRDSDGMVVSSHAAAADAQRFYGADPARLHVLHFAPRLDARGLADAAVRDEVLQRYGLQQPYFFLPNQYWKHKNHGLLIDALVHLRAQGRPLPLVVSTGKTEDLRNPDYFAQFRGRVNQLDLASVYRILGVVPRRDMLVLMAHAAAVINPSAFEGWSTGVEEAKALGKPLLVSGIAVHREQVAGLPDAEVFDVDDAAALAAAMDRHRAHPQWMQPHPPHPRADLYDAFVAQYLALMKESAVPRIAA